MCSATLGSRMQYRIDFTQRALRVVSKCGGELFDLLATEYFIDRIRKEFAEGKKEIIHEYVIYEKEDFALVLLRPVNPAVAVHVRLRKLETHEITDEVLERMLSIS